MVTLTRFESLIVSTVESCHGENVKEEEITKQNKNFLGVLPFGAFFRKKESDIFDCLIFNFPNSLLIYLWLLCNSTLRHKDETVTTLLWLEGGLYSVETERQRDSTSLLS